MAWGYYTPGHPDAAGSLGRAENEGGPRPKNKPGGGQGQGNSGLAHLQKSIS